MSGERRFIDDVRRLAGAPPAGQAWIGDDAAVLEGGLLAATDVLVEGVHFDLAWCTPADVGWKAMAVNLSDLAAMGGAPSVALLTLVVPADRSGLAAEVIDGVLEAAAEFECPLVGGDTSAGSSLSASVTALGAVGPAGAVLRSGARPGDRVFVTGDLGGVTRALDDLRRERDPTPVGAGKLSRPRPRLDEGVAAAAAGATAMIDISDGLSTDVLHVCDESGVGVRIDLGRLPLAAGALPMDALDGGDEYELCFAAPDPDAVAAAFADRGLAPPAEVGEITEAGTRVLLVEGSERELVPRGWEHSVS